MVGFCSVEIPVGASAGMTRRPGLALALSPPKAPDIVALLARKVSVSATDD
jgi:hypothetical protein